MSCSMNTRILYLGESITCFMVNPITVYDQCEIRVIIIRARANLCPQQTKYWSLQVRRTSGVAVSASKYSLDRPLWSPGFCRYLAPILIKAWEVLIRDWKLCQLESNSVSHYANSIICFRVKYQFRSSLCNLHRRSNNLAQQNNYLIFNID